MSNNVYFGKCISSGSDAQKKIVYMKEMPEQFNEGDLLAVFFTNKNTYETPSIVFRIGSTQQEVSVADDEGIAIKSHDIDTYPEGLWGAGETVLFCFVQRPNINSNDDESEENENEEELQSQGVLYLEIIGKLQASDVDYGIVKLNGIQKTDTLEDWLKDDDTEDDYTSAINTATIKALIKNLYSIPEEEEEQPLPALGLQWIQQGGDDLVSLGDLALTNGTGAIQIGIPRQLLGTKVTHTGQLYNNGNGGPDGDIDETGEPFITRYVPDDLFFIPGDEITPTQTPRAYLPGHGIALEGADLTRIKPKEGGAEGETEEKDEATIPYHIRFDKDKLVLGHNDSADFNKVIIRPALEVEGATNITGILNCADNIIGSKNISGNKLISTIDITEKGDLLRNRYSGKLKVVRLISAGQVIPVKSYKRYLLKWTGGTAWRPVGIVGYNADSMDTKNSGDVLWANIWECFVINTVGTSFYPKTDNNVSGATNDVQVAITNLNTSKSINVRVTVYVLCEKVL